MPESPEDLMKEVSDVLHRIGEDFVADTLRELANREENEQDEEI